MTPEHAYSAWAYRRSGWPIDTAPRWHLNEAGDQLALRLPDGLIGIYVHNRDQLDKLAWQEARLGELPPTWSSHPHNNPTDSRTLLFKVKRGWRWRNEVVAYGPVVVEGNEIDVWPTYAPDLGAAFTWQYGSDPDGLQPPSYWQIPELPPDWQHHLQSGWEGKQRPLGDDQTLVRRFLDSTFVPTGDRHDILTTETIYDTFTSWLGPNHEPPSKPLVGRICAERYDTWSGRTSQGFRRGYSGVRFPDLSGRFQ